MTENTGPAHVNAHDLAALERVFQQAVQQEKAKFPWLATKHDELCAVGAAQSILWLMEATWTNHGDFGEPYSDNAAVEIAINELIDYAREHGCRVTFDNVEIGSPYGVCVHPPEAAEEARDV